VPQNKKRISTGGLPPKTRFKRNTLLILTVNGGAGRSEGRGNQKAADGRKGGFQKSGELILAQHNGLLGRSGGKVKKVEGEKTKRKNGNDKGAHNSRAAKRHQALEPS